MKLSVLSPYYLIFSTIFGFGVYCSSVAWADTKGIEFIHKDWALVCDNAGACRAEGYQPDQADAKISVLLLRTAGASTLVKAQVQVTQVDEVLPFLDLNVNGLTNRRVLLNRDTQIGKLSAEQTQSVLKALQTEQAIEWNYGNKQWLLSTDGASASLLKMDDFQKRIDTPTALMRKGQRSTQKVLTAQPLPRIQLGKISQHAEKNIALSTPKAQKIRKLLLKTLLEDDQCRLLAENRADDLMSIYKLNAHYRLVSVPCWQAAYNMGDGYWVMNSSLTKVQQYVTDLGTDYHQGKISALHKGRGLGDCISKTEWLWNGQKFIKSYANAIPKCKGFVGGAWEMPIYKSIAIESP